MTKSKTRKQAFETTFNQAGINAHDIDLFELYDINTWEIVRQFETLGLCEEGEGSDFLYENHRNRRQFPYKY